MCGTHENIDLLRNLWRSLWRTPLSQRISFLYFIHSRTLSTGGLSVWIRLLFFCVVESESSIEPVHLNHFTSSQVYIICLRDWTDKGNFQKRSTLLTLSVICVGKCSLTTLVHLPSAHWNMSQSHFWVCLFNGDQCSHIFECLCWSHMLKNALGNGNWGIWVCNVIKEKKGINKRIYKTSEFADADI